MKPEEERNGMRMCENIIQNKEFKSGESLDFVYTRTHTSKYCQEKIAIGELNRCYVDSGLIVCTKGGNL